jgi:predicted AAA+ superfamily ATPase
MPSTLGFEFSEKEQVLQDIYNSILLKDIVKRNDVRDIDLLHRILMFILSKCWSAFFCQQYSEVFKK